MPPRSTSKWIGSLVLGLALAPVSFGSRQAGRVALSGSSAARKPNVLFLVLDDTNDWVGCLGGNPQAQTPNIDRLAERGVLFTNAHCAFTVCQPSRLAVLTGRFPHQIGVYDNDVRLRSGWPDIVTLPQHFRASGYTTICAGKVFHVPDAPSWDTSFSSFEKPRPKSRPLNGLKPASSFDWGPLDAADAEMPDGQVATWVAAQLERTHEQPLRLRSATSALVRPTRALRGLPGGRDTTPRGLRGRPRGRSQRRTGARPFPRRPAGCRWSTSIRR